jgi:hypothetical protein
MSLTWVQAASNSQWWLSRVSGDADAVKRHTQQIAAAHGVSPTAARRAYIAVTDAIRARKHQPTDYGFASQPKTDRHGWMETPIPDDHDIHDYEGPRRWGHLESEQVDIHRGVHATQQQMDPHAVAHNLFHPGKLVPTSKRNLGNPDHDPDQEDHAARAEADGVEGNSDLTRFHRTSNGRLNLADGHHRLAADLLLGKTHTSGLVWNDKKPPAKTCDGPNCEPCREQEQFYKDIEMDWPPRPNSHKTTS